MNLGGHKHSNHSSGGVEILNRIDREGLSLKVVFEQRSADEGKNKVYV